MANENLTKPRIGLPERATVGEIVEVRAGVRHVMETGNRRDGEGRPIPRNVVHTVVARFAGTVVFTATLGSGMAANPVLVFHLRVPAPPGPGTLEVTWTDDEGRTVSERAVLEVVA
jgi:sulfur-oxidizing protein SoxZ